MIDLAAEDKWFPLHCLPSLCVFKHTILVTEGAAFLKGRLHRQRRHHQHEHHRERGHERHHQRRNVAIMVAAGLTQSCPTFEFMVQRVVFRATSG
jgi:hypothetical protein